jgi:hypothetical protein
MFVQLAEQNEAAVPFKHPIHKWVKGQGERFPKLTSQRERINML